MKAFTYFLLLPFLTFFIACTTQKQRNKAREFEVSFKSLAGDTIVTTAVYCNDHILCLREDHQLFVLDTLLDPVDSLTKLFQPFKIYQLIPCHDTMLVETADTIFYIDRDYSLKKYNRQRQPFKYGSPYYIDSTYCVSACSAGEWGGTVFFWNQKTNKTYAYPATAVQQVLKFKGQYIVSNYLAHLSGFSDFLSIKDPDSLYEYKEEKKIYCNWFSSHKVNTTTLPGVKLYKEDFLERNLATFTRNNNLYTIYCTDSATILAKHDNFHLKTVDTLLKRNLDFLNASTHLTKNYSVTAYRSYRGTSDSTNKEIHYQNTGLVFINNNKITFLEFETPHMWSKKQLK